MSRRTTKQRRAARRRRAAVSLLRWRDPKAFLYECLGVQLHPYQAQTATWIAKRMARQGVAWVPRTPRSVGGPL